MVYRRRWASQDERQRHARELVGGLIDDGVAKLQADLDSRQAELGQLLESPSEAPVQEVMDRIEELRGEIGDLEAEISMGADLKEPLQATAAKKVVATTSCFSG